MPQCGEYGGVVGGPASSSTDEDLVRSDGKTVGLFLKSLVIHFRGSTILSLFFSAEQWPVLQKVLSCVAS